MSFKDYPMALAPGSVLNGRYIIEDVLGQGGFGITYKARDEAEHKYVAIKEYLPAALAYRAKNNPFLTPFSKERQDDFEYGRKQFLNEAMRLGKFNYTPGIVHIHRFFEENGTAYFAMDLEDGRDFSTYLRQHGGKISWMEACSILLPVMRALEIVHSAGIIHRDIAPDNIYINKNGSVKLLDFGAARNNLGNKSASVDAIIKHGFSPKEQYSRRGNQDAFTDVYALAATFYYAITGVIPPESIERPDYADPSNPDPLDPPHKWAADLPPALENTILKAMSVRTEKRFQTMEEFREQVERAFRTGTTIPVEPEVPPADPPLPPGKNRIFGFLIALVIVLAAGAFYLFARNIADKDGEISGYVLEEGTGTPLHGVDVILKTPCAWTERAHSPWRATCRTLGSTPATRARGDGGEHCSDDECRHQARELIHQSPSPSGRRGYARRHRAASYEPPTRCAVSPETQPRSLSRPARWSCHSSRAAVAMPESGNRAWHESACMTSSCV